MLKQHIVIVFFIVTISSSLMQADDDIYKAKMECMAKNNLTGKDFVEIMKAKPEELTENVLCVIKCVMELSKIIDENGNINPDNIENTSVMSQLPDEQKSQLKKCLGQIDKIETCQDTAKTLPCFNAVDAPWGQ